jgi:hypothetical protein
MNQIQSQASYNIELNTITIKHNNWIFDVPIRTWKIQSIQEINEIITSKILREREIEKHTTIWLGSSPDFASSTRLSEYVSPQITKRVIWECIDQKWLTTRAQFTIESYKPITRQKVNYATKPRHTTKLRPLIPTIRPVPNRTRSSSWVLRFLLSILQDKHDLESFERN